MPITTSLVEPDLTQPDGGRARRQASVRAVAVRLLVVAVVFALVEVVCALAGWDSENWSAVLVATAYVAADHLLIARRTRQAEITADQAAKAEADAAGR